MASLEWLTFSNKRPIMISPALESMTHFLTHLSKIRYFSATLLCLVLIIILLVMVWARAFYGSMQACQQGEIYLKANQYINAIAFFDRSIHWYIPFNPYVHESATHLWEISKEAQKRGNIRLALIAAKAIRRGFVAARSFFTPGRDWIERCDLRIHELVMIKQVRKGDLKKEELAEISVFDNPQVKGPDILWSIILLTGLLGWIGSAIGFIMSGFRTFQETMPLSFSKFKWIVLWAVFFAIWIVGMMKA